MPKKKANSSRKKIQLSPRKHFGPNHLAYSPGPDPGEQPVFPSYEIGVAPDMNGKFIFVPLHCDTSTSARIIKST